MANKPLKSIKFPGLPNTYTVPQVDSTPTQGSTNAVSSGGVYAVTADLDARVEDLEQGGSGSGLTDDIKSALLQIARKVAYIDKDGQDYYDDLYNALYTATLSSITATFTQGSAVIYDTDSLDDLKQYLVVTANYSDSTSRTVSNYTLSGTLAVGTSTITATYQGEADTFEVEVYTCRYLTSSDVVSTYGFSGLTITDGTFEYTSSESFSLAILQSTIDRIQYTFLNALQNDPRGAACIIFRVSGNTYYGIDNFGGVYAFTKSGSKYNAAGASGITTVSIENLNTFADNTKVTASLDEQHLLTIENDSGGKITINNANMIGWWTDSYSDWHIRWANVEVITQ